MNTMKLVLPVLLACLLVGMVAAQTGKSGLDKGPGFVTPDSPFYRVEVIVDNVAVSVGVMKAGDVAQERAAEAKTMQEQGKPKAAQRAAAAASEAVKAAGKGSSNTTTGIDKAIKTLNDVKSNAPPEARDGLTTAIDSLQQVKKILPNATPSGTPSNGTPTPPKPSKPPKKPDKPTSNDTDTDIGTYPAVPSYCLPPTPIPDDWTLPANCTAPSLPSYCLPPDPVPSDWTTPANCTRITP